MTNCAQTTDELLTKANALSHMSVGELARQMQFPIPNDTRSSKGFVGQLLELALGTTSGNKPQPDFADLGIELKTIPVNLKSVPQESTFICSVSLQHTLGETWEESLVFCKLKKILFVPIITTHKSQPFVDRKIGRAILWQPSLEEEQMLRADWEELMEMISLGQLANITANHGTYLQLRPKAANARMLCKGFGAEGEPVLTLPRGFYLRTSFTKKILK